MNAGYLIFHPATDQPPPATSQLLARLTACGLPGQLLPGTPRRFLTGPQFLQRITFLGCSPRLPLEADSDQDALCTVRLLDPCPSPVLITDQACPSPRCPGCGHPFPEWRGLATRQSTRIDCPACDRQTAPQDLNWRQLGGMGRLFFAISQVFPGEAVPTAGLMDTLRETGGEWRYFYARGPLLWQEGEPVQAFRGAGVTGR